MSEMKMNVIEVLRSIFEDLRVGSFFERSRVKTRNQGQEQYIYIRIVCRCECVIIWELEAHYHVREKLMQENHTSLSYQDK